MQVLRPRRLPPALHAESPAAGQLVTVVVLFPPAFGNRRIQPDL